jgi:hypothetical protein
MKKHVLIATGLAVLSTNAFATKARMEALSQNADRGSFFIDDSRNVFRNAAHVNSMKNYVLTEWGQNASATADSPAAPRAEGGFFREGGSLAYGVYMGSTFDSQNATRTTAAQGSTGFLARDNQLDLFVGGDAGVEWGARVSYAKVSNKEVTATVTKETSALGVGLGMLMGDLSAWANLDLSDKSEGAVVSGDKWEADLGLHLGASYDVSGMTVFAEYNKTGSERALVSDTAFKPVQEDSSIQVGVAKVQEQSSTSRYFYSLAYSNSTAEDKDTSTSTVEVKTTNLPVTLGFEADATSWLTLRGSVSHNLPLMDKVETKTTGAATTETTSTNTTNVAAGATLNFGKLKVDGTVGTLNAANAAGETGTLKLDNVMTRVAVHYWF